ncbi:phosphatase [Paraglaciecola Antarctic GD virus 1]|nr:phosphatase [Paraglaciecola Antarctic GD virus 1]
MIFALDYDDTYTAAPVLFKAFVANALMYGHTVKFVTYRPAKGSNGDIEADALDLGINIVYTAGRQKQHVFKADVWIDDAPATIVRCDDLKNYHTGCLVNKDLS